MVSYLLFLMDDFRTFTMAPQLNVYLWTSSNSFSFNILNG